MALIGIDVDNTGGTIEVQSGTLKIPKTHQKAGFPADETELNKGGIFNSDGFFDEESGSLSNTDSSEVYGDVVNSGGEVDPGGVGAAGILTIDGTSGSYTQLSGGSLNIDIGGTTAGSGYDQLNISGQAILSGTLNLNLIGGYTPNIGDSFIIVGYGTYLGNFQTITGLRFSSGKRFDVQYNSTSIVLTVVSDSSGSAPTVTGLGTTTGTTAGGTSVTVTGTGFTDVTGVFFGSTPANSFTVTSSTSLTVVAPPNATGTDDVTVTGVNGTSATSSADYYTYTAASSPTVTALSSSQGGLDGYDLITLTGTNFLGTTAVDFGSTAAPFFLVNSPTSITVLSPADSSGTVDVTVVTYAGMSATSSADHFTYETAPTVTGLSFLGGSSAGGSTITLTGTNFTDATEVLFGNVAANFTVVSDTSISATVPAQPAGT
jgi:hypothetical protein